LFEIPKIPERVILEEYWNFLVMSFLPGYFIMLAFLGKMWMWEIPVLDKIIVSIALSLVTTLLTYFIVDKISGGKLKELLDQAQRKEKESERKVAFRKFHSELANFELNLLVLPFFFFSGVVFVPQVRLIAGCFSLYLNHVLYLLVALFWINRIKWAYNFYKE